MTISTLVQFISCVCEPAEINEAVAQGFKEIYIPTIDGIIKHHQLRGEDRYIRVKVDDIPGRIKPPAVTECVNFLPAGKIPFAFFQQIEAFFRKVIELKGTALEAMIFIIWNPTQGYHLFVPTQSVGAASVNFDPKDLPGGSIIVVDIHSHGSMAAFYSGTDNTNDAPTIRFSGVFGKLTSIDPVTKLPLPAMTVWRFNYYTKKFNATTEDIFETENKPVIEVPQEWLDQVKIATPPLVKTYSPTGKGKQGHRFPKGSLYKPEFADMDFDHGVQSTFHGFVGEDVDMDENAMEKYYKTLRDSNNSFRNEYNSPATNAPSGKVWRYDPNSHNQGSSPETALSIVVEDPSIEEEVGAYQMGKSQTHQSSFLDVDGSLLKIAHTPTWETTLLGEIGIIDETYESISAFHGTEVADAWFDIDSTIHILNGKDSILSSIGCDMFELMSDEGQESFFKEVFGRLAPTSKRNIETNGM
jgi:PRTRC genetic system protein A